MKHLKLFAAGAFLLAATISKAQSTKAHHVHFHTLHFYTYGLPAFDDIEDSNECAKKIQEHYGIAYKVKAGCVLRPSQELRYRIHNNRVDRKMRARFGDNWYEQYRKELEQCGKQA